MRSLRCDECGTRALMAASTCPKCGHGFDVRDGFGELLPLAHCPTCDSYYPLERGSCRWCGTRPERAPVAPRVWKGVGAAAFAGLAWGAWLVRDVPPTSVPGGDSTHATLVADTTPPAPPPADSVAIAYRILIGADSADTVSLGAPTVGAPAGQATRLASTGVVLADTVAVASAGSAAPHDQAGSQGQPLDAGLLADSPMLVPPPADDPPLAASAPVEPPPAPRAAGELPVREATPRDAPASDPPIGDAPARVASTRGTPARGARTREEPARNAAATKAATTKAAPTKAATTNARPSSALAKSKSARVTPPRAAPRPAATAKAPPRAVVSSKAKARPTAPSRKSPRWVSSVVRRWVVVRANPSGTARIIASIGPNTRVQLGESRGAWRRVRAKGLAGWVEHRSFAATGGAPRGAGRLAAR